MRRSILEARSALLWLKYKNVFHSLVTLIALRPIIKQFVERGRKLTHGINVTYP